MSLLLTSDQITSGANSLSNDQLTASQVADLVSVFRGYLGSLASEYLIAETLAAASDASSSEQKCAKLAACLDLFQDNQFTPQSGFAPTAANRTGFNYSLDGENYEVFKYAFGLFWDIPAELENQWLGGFGRFKSSEGVFVRR